jgi:hypothetical protein
MAKSTAPGIQRLLGASGDLGSRLGLDNKWILQAVKAGGNYAEIFERNVGKASPLKLDRGLNATWSKGGLDVRDPVQVMHVASAFAHASARPALTSAISSSP